MNELKCAIGYQHNDGAVSFEYLEYISFNNVIDIINSISNAKDVKNAISEPFINGFALSSDRSDRYEHSYKGVMYCLLCKNKYHYVNHAKKWKKIDLIFLFNKGRWYVNDTTFMRYDKWYSLSTYLLRDYYEYHHEKLANIYGFDYCIYEVISYKKSYYMISKFDLYDFLRREEIVSFNIKNVNDDLKYQHETSLRNVHNREIKVKFITPNKIIDALKFFNEYTKNIK